MKPVNVTYIQNNIQDIVKNAVQCMSSSRATTENDLSSELIRSIGKYCHLGTNGHFTSSNGLSVPLAIEFKLLPRNRYLGPTDIVMFDNHGFSYSDSLGIEIKVFGNHYGNGDYKSVNYFITGKHDNDNGDNDYDKGKHLKNKKQTHCQEGQLLKDYIKAVKVINQNTINNPNLFFLVGTIINDEAVTTAPNKNDVECYIKKLISPYSKNKFFKCWRNASGYHSNVSEQIVTTEIVTVLTPIQNKNLTYFPYAIEIKK